MSPASQSGWDGVSLPAILRGPRRRGREADAYPQMTDAGVIEREDHRGSVVVWKDMGWTWDSVLMCWRWADYRYDPWREAVRRAREACALEEATA